MGHRYFKNIDRTLKNNIDYLIFTQLDKKRIKYVISKYKFKYIINRISKY